MKADQCLSKGGTSSCVVVCIMSVTLAQFGQRLHPRMYNFNSAGRASDISV